MQAAGQVAKQAGKPVIAFSTDATVASRGVYLLSFLAQEEVDRIIAYASAQGRRSFAALIPENTYGNVVEAQFREAAARRGARVVAMERYAAGQAQAAVQRIAPLIVGPSAQADAIFLPDNAEGLPGVAQALAEARFDPQKVKPLGTGVWNDPRIFKHAGAAERLVRGARLRRLQRLRGALPGAVQRRPDPHRDALLRRRLARRGARAHARLAALRRTGADEPVRLLGRRRGVPVQARRHERPGARGARDPQRRDRDRQPRPEGAVAVRDLIPSP